MTKEISNKQSIQMKYIVFMGKKQCLHYKLMKEISQPSLGVGISSQWGLASRFTLPPNHSRNFEIIWIDFRCYHTIFLSLYMRSEPLFKCLK